MSMAKKKTKQQASQTVYEYWASTRKRLLLSASGRTADGKLCYYRPDGSLFTKRYPGVGTAQAEVAFHLQTSGL